MPAKPTPDPASSKRAETSEPARPNKDVALVWPGAEGGRLNILRQRDDQLEAGVVQPLREGMPIHGEVIQLTQRQASPLYDVEVIVPAPRRALPRGNDLAGPAQVATEDYRKNWDQIYGRRSPSKVLN